MACTSASSIHSSPTLVRLHQAQRTVGSPAEVVLARSRLSATASSLRRGGSEGKRAYLKMLTARAVTSRMLSAETADSVSISAFARRVSGIASVGLNAIEFVNEM